MALRKRGETWWFDIRGADGERIRRSTGQTDKDLAARVEHDAVEEVYEAKRKRKLGIAGPKSIALADGVALFLSTREGEWSAAYYSTNFKFYRDYLLRATDGVGGPDASVASVSRDIATAFRDQLASEIGRVSLNRAIAAFSVFWTWAVKRGFALSNPWLGQERNREVKHVPPPLTEAQLALYLASYDDARVRRAATVALDTGLRASELRRIRRGHWDDSMRLRVISQFIGEGKRATTKNGESRAVPLSPRAKAALEAEFDASGDEMFSTLPCYRAAKERALKAAGLPYFTWHDQRHYALTRMADGGLSLHDLKDIAGWRTVSMADRYIHGSAERAASIVANFGCDPDAPKSHENSANGGEIRDEHSEVNPEESRASVISGSDS